MSKQTGIASYFKSASTTSPTPALKSATGTAASSSGQRVAAAATAATASATTASKQKRSAADISDSGATAASGDRVSSGAPSPPASKQSKTASSAAARASVVGAGAPPPSVAALPAQEVDAFKARLVKNVIKSIKQTGHAANSKPWTTVTEGISSKALATAALGDLGSVTSSSANSERREVRGHNRIAQWLGLVENYGLIHPVKYSGKVWVMAGEKAFVYAWAAVEEMVVTIKPNLLTLKIRTRCHAYGVPSCAKLSPVDDDDAPVTSTSE